MPSRAWRLRVAAAAVVVVAASAAHADGEWMRVVEQSDERVVLLLQAPAPERDGESWRVPGFDAGGEPGLPIVYERATFIAVPGPRGARLEVTAAESRELGRTVARIHPALLAQSERRAAGDAGASGGMGPAVARAIGAVYPEAVVALGAQARVRGRDVVALRFQPLQYLPDGSARYTESVRVELVFADRVTRRAPTAVASEAAADPIQSALPNAATASAWPLTGAAASKSVGARVQGDPLPAERVRIRIPQRGLYELSYADLQGAGVPVASPQFEPRSLRVFFDRWKSVALYADSIPASWQPDGDLEEAAIWVPGEDDGFSSTDPDDRVVFYALGPEGWEDLGGTSADSLAWFTHPYDRDRYAWLVWGGTFGRRVAAVDAAPLPTDALVSRTWSRVHLEEDHDFDAVDDLWYWDEVRPGRSVSESVVLDLGGELAVTGALRVTLGYGTSSGGHVVDVRWGGNTLGRAQFTQLRGAASTFPFNNVVLQPTNPLLLTVPSGFTVNTLFLEADVTWDRLLTASPARVLEWSRRSAVEEAFDLAGFGAAPPIVWDVTDALSPQRLTNAQAAGAGAATTWRVRNVRPLGRRAHSLAVGEPVNVQPRDLVRRVIAPLRARTTAPEMVILTHATLRTAAERLAQYRRTHWAAGGTPEILVVDVADVYDNFSGGRVDPLAMRNYLKFLYELDATPRLVYALFFGDATFDPRRLRPASGPTLVPTVQPGHYGQERDGVAGFSAVDDWLGELDTPRNIPPDPYPVPDLAHGRITARSPAEAERIVDKIIGYETTSGFGTWRTRIIMAADDECHPLNGCGGFENSHIDNSEALVQLVPADLDVVKFYLTEFPSVLGQKPAARTAFIRQWSDGCAVINYQGHGAARQLSDEVLFLSVDVPALTNGARAPLFLPISCTVSEFDGPDRQSMCEDLLASGAGGAVATIGATKPTFIGSNYSLNRQLFVELFRDGSTSRIPLGVVEQRAKVRTTGPANETYLLLGDPSMTLVLPGAKVHFTAGVDSLLVAQRARVEGEVVEADSAATRIDFDGQAEVEVFGTADESGYRRENPTVILRYDLQGPPLYRGTVPIVDGRLAFQFIVPAGARTGTKGRVSAYAFGPGGDAKGADPTVRVALSSQEPEPSRGAPRIALRFPNDRTRVKAGTVLTAEIRDENGINIQGTTLRNSIYLDFDARNEPLNVTAQFRYVAGSDSVGSVSVPLPADLEPGAHSATVIASDNLLNTATATVEFEVVDAAVTQLVNVIAFPNPFRDWTRFFFEITDPAEVEIAVFTTSGREVWRERRRFEAGTQGSIKWDGVDLREDTLANGTYLYRLRAKPDRPGAPALERIGKVVIMR